MRKYKIVSIFVIAIFGVVSASPLFGLSKKKTSSPLDGYDHEMHNGIFDGVVECNHCHIDDVYDRAGILAKWRKKGVVRCHECHKPDTPKPIMPVPKDCKTCHAKLPKPANHDAYWSRVHQSVAKQNDKYCRGCHEAFFCIDCHKRRDTIQTRMHDRNFISTHSIEARANPRRCDSCHSVTYCKQCHSSP